MTSDDARSAPRTRAVRRIVLVALVVVIATGLVYLRYFRPSPSPLPPSSTVRSLLVSPGAWAAADGDAGATRVTESAPRLDGEIAWRRQFGTPVVAPIVTDGRALYVALEDARLVALSVDDGRELWSISVPGQLNAAPTIAGDALYAGFRNGRVVALDADTGTTRWTYATGRTFASSPVVVDGIVWANAWGKLIALDAENGRLLWERNISSELGSTSGAPLVGPPVVGDEYVVIATRSRVLFFDRRTGSQTFAASLRDPAHIATARGTVIAVSSREAIAFDADSRLPWWEGLRRPWFHVYLWGMAPNVPPVPFLWSQRASCEPRAPVLDSQQVVFACGEGLMRSYDLRTGDELWARTGSPLVNSPVLTATGLLVAEQHALVLLDAESGAELARRSFDEIELRDATVTAGGIYLLTQSDELFVIR